MNKVIEKDYSFLAAGRVWLVPELVLDELPDGSLALNLKEIDRIHKAIANEICGSASSLTLNEFEFLCDITCTTYTNVAQIIDVTKSALTKWKGTGKPLGLPRSIILKRWFWSYLFEKSINDVEIPLIRALSDHELLRFAHDQAIERGIVDAIQERAA